MSGNGGTNPAHKGRCKRCYQSVEKKVKLSDGKETKHLHCSKYNKPCRSVAWNCPDKV